MAGAGVLLMLLCVHAMYAVYSCVLLVSRGLLCPARARVKLQGRSQQWNGCLLLSSQRGKVPQLGERWLGFISLCETSHASICPVNAKGVLNAWGLKAEEGTSWGDHS